MTSQNDQERRRNEYMGSNFERPLPCLNCKHLTKIGNNISLKGWTCKAFPKEIPVPILRRTVRHVTVLDIFPGQVMPYLFESKEQDVMYDFDGVRVESQGE